MSDVSDSQNRSESPFAEIPEADTSPEASSSSDDGERSTPSGLPPAATRTRKKRNSDDEDSDFVAEEVTSKPKRKVVAKEHEGQQSKKGTSKVKQSAVAKKLNLEEPAPSKVKKTSKRKRVVYAEPQVDDAEEEEEDAPQPPPQKAKFMGDAIRAQASSKPKKPAPAKAAPAKPKRTTRSIPASEKNKGEMPPSESDEEHVLLKLRPKLPLHNDAHPQAEDMKARKDKGLRLWRQSDPYAVRRRTAVDPRFHTKE